MKTTVDELLLEAVNLGASDLHISTGSEPRVRVNGSIKKLNHPVVRDKDAEELFLSMSGVDLKVKVDLKTEGQYDFGYSLWHKGRMYRFRVNIFSQKQALSAVFRVLSTEIPDYSKLGLPVSIFNLRRKRRGMFLVVGTTGSGKTTTLASFLDTINKNDYKHIITLEEPIEYLHWHSRSLVSQRGIGIDCNSFSSGLRAALREDPDVILVGEMRDLETTEIAIRAAETGHLVCSTLHTMGASETINRIIDMYPERQHNMVRSQLSTILEAIVAQQLMPKKDGSGYIIAYEIMYRNKHIQTCIRENRLYDIDDYLKTEDARKEGMIDMDSTILDRYRKGIITSDTAVDYAFDWRQMSKSVGG